MRMASVPRLNYRLLPITKAGKGCSTRSEGEDLDYSAMSAHESEYDIATLQ